MSAISARLCAGVGEKPGKPTLPRKSAISRLSRSTRLPALSATRNGAGACALATSSGAMLAWPNSALYVEVPGLFAAGGVSVTAPLACSQVASPRPQCTASPRNALVVFAYEPRGGVVPNTDGMSPAFSSTMFAVENAPTEQPALLKATHGSGATWVGAVALAGTVGE